MARPVQLSMAVDTGRRIWIRRSPDDEADEVEEDNRVGERRSETPRRSGTLRRKDQRRKGSQRLD